MKVTKDFYCRKENKKYLKGDTYKGKRKDLGDYLTKPEKVTKTAKK